MSHTVTKTGDWQHPSPSKFPSKRFRRAWTPSPASCSAESSCPDSARGEVPLDRVRVEFAAHIEQEFLDSALPEITGRTLGETELVPVVPPTITNLKFSPGQPLTFDALVDVAPRVEVKSGRPAGHPPRARHRRRRGRGRREQPARGRRGVRGREAPGRDGDVILLDSQRLDANGRRLANTRSKGLRIQLGSPDLPDLETALTGAEEGQERSPSEFPAEHGQAELAGKSIRYVVSIRKIQEKKLRDLDDNFARDLFRLDSLQALRDRVRQNLEAEEGGRVRREMEGAITEELIQRNPFDMPERLVTYMLGQVVREQTNGREVGPELQKQLEEHYKPGVERSLRREVLLMGVAMQEKLEVSEDEISAEIDRMCPRTRVRHRRSGPATSRRTAVVRWARRSSSARRWTC